MGIKTLLSICWCIIIGLTFFVYEIVNDIMGMGRCEHCREYRHLVENKYCRRCDKLYNPIKEKDYCEIMDGIK